MVGLYTDSKIRRPMAKIVEPINQTPEKDMHQKFPTIHINEK